MIAVPLKAFNGVMTIATVKAFTGMITVVPLKAFTDVMTPAPLKACTGKLRLRKDSRCVTEGFSLLKMLVLTMVPCCQESEPTHNNSL